MKNTNYLLLFLSLFLLNACNKDLGTAEVTYTKATAVYGDLEEIRNTPLLTTAQTIENPGKIFVADQLLLIGEEEKGIHIVDNTDPENPTNLSFLQIPGNREFFVKGNYLYAESYYDLVKIDISDKTNPTLVSRVKSAFYDEELVNNDGETLIGFTFERVTEELNADTDLYRNLTNTPDNIAYFDYAQRVIPPSQVPASFAGNSSASVGSVNRMAHADGHLFVISLANLYAFEDAGQNLTAVYEGWLGNNMETVFSNDKHLFIGTRNSMEIVDVQNPSLPNRISTFTHATSCDPVLPAGEVAYVTLRTGDDGLCPGDVNALVVVDIENLWSPQEVQQFEMESPYGMVLINDKLYVGEGQNGMSIFDATNRRNLQLEKHESNIEAYDMIAHPTRSDLLLVAGPEGILQYAIEGNSGMSLLSAITY